MTPKLKTEKDGNSNSKEVSEMPSTNIKYDQMGTAARVDIMPDAI